MHNDLMFVISVVLLLITTRDICGQQTTIYVKRGDTAEICDNRPTSIYAYEYRSFDGKKNSIIEPLKHVRYTNPYQTSLLRIMNVSESDSGLYKCPQDDTEWQKLQVYIPVQYVQLNNMQITPHMHTNDLCGFDNNDCLATVEGQSLDVICSADGYPRPEIDITIDRNGSKPTIMALASTTTTPSPLSPSNLNAKTKSLFSETYRITGLKPEDNGRNIICHVNMKHIDKNLSLSSTKKLYIEFAPKVLEKSKKIYCGINQTRTINCTVLRANPPHIRYAINGLSSSIIRRTYDNQNDLQYTIDLTPTATDQFGYFSITANNSIGSDTCTYELIHGGVPDAISQCHVDRSSNITITISCTKSFAQGDSEGYACTLFKYNEKSNQKMFEEIARTKSCIFALENFIEPVEFRVAAFNRYGSLPVNTYGYIIRLNQPTFVKETPFFTRQRMIIIGSILGGILLLIFLCCLCGTCHRDSSKSPAKSDYYHKTKYSHTANDNEELKVTTDDTIAHLVPNGNERRAHQNGTVYDIPSHLNNNGRYPLQTSSTPISSAYHQQRSNNNNNNNHHTLDQDSLTDSSNSIPTRTRTYSNKFYGHPVVDSRYGPLSPTAMVVPSTIKRNHDHEDEGDESPVYSTTTDVMSESGSFLVPSSSKRYGPPPPKPRYSTLSSVRQTYGNMDKTPLPKPRSRSNSRTRLNNPNADNGSLLYEERPVSSSDSGMGQSDVICLSNGDTVRTGLVRAGQTHLQNQPINPPVQQQTRYQTLTSPVAYGTEC